jgi:hypothetical protein
MTGLDLSGGEELSSPFEPCLRILLLEKGKLHRPFLPKTCLKLQIAGTMEDEDEMEDGMKETNG